MTLRGFKASHLKERWSEPLAAMAIRAYLVSSHHGLQRATPGSECNFRCVSSRVSSVATTIEAWRLDLPLAQHHVWAIDLRI